MHSWRVLILPFLEHQQLYDEYDFAQPWNSQVNLRIADRMPEVFAFHGEYHAGLTTTNYLAVVGADTLWPGAATRSMADVTDGPQSTIMVVENTGQQVHWMEPRDLRYDAMSLVVNSPRGLSSKYRTPAVVLADGSLRELQPSLPEGVLRALLTAQGGEELVQEGDSWRRLSDGRRRETRAGDPPAR